MDDHNIVIKPLVTEQSMHFAGKYNAYAFQVNRRANKTQVREAVQRLYGVKVVDVRTMNRKGKPRRRGRNIGSTSNWKKAVVVLHEDHHIDLF
ncbi:50S ribosomal protein L23 [Anaerohalosphaera lusitana]|uniref:Large ribosomal subunit protein uL23 n=1 Tax=Anaerohalosphaera lusitana TaxID=1936003 RepID=A0A1U9NPK4_9BACT|nr:50S ribosomal protein L23 [Anaerohalosphaera lusitana]AQT69851.1 50S ribosomal protein L23 [Anaerohalosphaera lusitana]